jgi:hypothetical protein
MARVLALITSTEWEWQSYLGKLNESSLVVFLESNVPSSRHTKGSMILSRSLAWILSAWLRKKIVFLVLRVTEVCTCWWAAIS